MYFSKIFIFGEISKSITPILPREIIIELYKYIITLEKIFTIKPFFIGEDISYSKNYIFK